MEEPRDEPTTLQDSYNDISVDHLLNNFQLVGTDTRQASNGSLGRWGRGDILLF